jgi:hypothetical protein
MSELITYDSSFFEKVLSFPIYRTKNVVALTSILQGLEIQVWTREGGEVEEQQSPIDRVATNYWAMTYILNRLNKLLLFASKKQTLVSGKEGDISTLQLDFMTNHIGNKDGFENEFDRFHQLLDFFKEYILASGSEAFEEIQLILNKEVPVTETENIFVKNIGEFFPKAIDIKAIQNFGESIGLDVEFTYRGNKFKTKVVSCQDIQRDGEYYRVLADFNPKLDGAFEYFVFTLPNNYIYIFELDKTKFRDLSGDTLHNQTSQKGLSYLFHVDTLVEYKKVF